MVTYGAFPWGGGGHERRGSWGPRKEGVVIKSQEGLVRCYQGTGLVLAQTLWTERRGKQAYPRPANSPGRSIAELACRQHQPSGVPLDLVGMCACE